MRRPGLIGNSEYAIEYPRFHENAFRDKRKQRVFELPLESHSREVHNMSSNAFRRPKASGRKHCK